MPEFPSTPVSPAELLEQFLPAAFSELSVPSGVEALALQLGVRLEGEGGGEWVVEVADGKVSVRPEGREATAYSYVQSVDDWRGALWEGRGGWVGKGASALFSPANGEARAAANLASNALPAVLEAMQELRGLLQVVVAGAEGDWQVGLQLGPGEIPAEPTAVVSVSSEDVEQMVAGELDPMEAFMAGRIRVTGDMTLILQLQAAQMQAASALAGGAKG